MSRFRKGVSLLVGAGKESSLLRGSVSLLSQNAVVYGISFISSILLARWLGPVQLGLFYVASLLPNYAEKFGRVGLIDHATVYYIGKKKYGPGMAAGHLTVLFLLSSSLVILGYALFKDQFQDAFLKTRALPSYYVWTAVASIPALLLIVGYGKIQLALGLIRSYNASQVMRPLLFLIMGLVFWFFQWDFYGAILAAAVSVWAAVLIAGVRFESNADDDGTGGKSAGVGSSSRPVVLGDGFEVEHAAKSILYPVCWSG
jgi:O-antigen/teichoic acid export membrane protein